MKNKEQLPDPSPELVLGCLVYSSLTNYSFAHFRL